MSVAELKRLCRVWQRRLRLQDWDVTVKLQSAEEMPDQLGNAAMEPEEMRAVISLRDGGELEATLAHELLHLRLVSFGDDDLPEQQVAMNLLAAAFMRAYRRTGAAHD